jgi:hypothetical protein
MRYRPSLPSATEGGFRLVADLRGHLRTTCGDLFPEIPGELAGRKGAPPLGGDIHRHAIGQEPQQRLVGGEVRRLDLVSHAGRIPLLALHRGDGGGTVDKSRPLAGRGMSERAAGPPNHVEHLLPAQGAVLCEQQSCEAGTSSRVGGGPVYERMLGVGLSMSYRRSGAISPPKSTSYLCNWPSKRRSAAARPLVPGETSTLRKRRLGFTTRVAALGEPDACAAARAATSRKRTLKRRDRAARSLGRRSNGWDRLAMGQSS